MICDENQSLQKLGDRSPKCGGALIFRLLTERPYMVVFCRAHFAAQNVGRVSDKCRELYKIVVNHLPYASRN